MTGEDPWKKRGEALRGPSQAVAIPSLILGSVLGCGALGYFSFGFLGWNQAIGALLRFGLGMGVAVYEMRLILKRISGKRR